MADLTIYANTGDLDSAYGESGTEYTEINLTNDYILFSSGSDVVKDGESLPSTSEINKAGIIITDSDQVLDKYFLADYSANELKEISLAGDNDSQYVLAFSFDGATTSEPVLEVWDDSDMDSTDLYVLGEGTPADSWIWGITTTTSTPGSNWLGTSPSVGSKLAGASSGYYLDLNDGNGALTEATVLYCQLKIIVPANFSHSGLEQPKFVVKFTSN